MRNFNSILAAAAALVFALFGGCGADLETVQCTSNGACPVEMVCCRGECLRTTEAPQVCLTEMGDTGNDATDVGFDSPAEVSDTTDDASDAGFDTLADVEDSGDVADARGDTPADVNIDVTDVGGDAPTDVGEDPTGPARYCVYLHPADLDTLRNPADLSDLPDVMFTNSSGVETSLGEVGECFSAAGLEGMEFWVEATKPMYINPCGRRVFPPCESGDCTLDYPRWVNDKFLEYPMIIDARTGNVTTPRAVHCIEEVALPVPPNVYCPYTSAVIDGGDEGWLCAEAEDAPGPVSQCREHREDCGFETRSETIFGLEFEYTSEYFELERWLVHHGDGRFDRR